MPDCDCEKQYCIPGIVLYTQYTQVIARHQYTGCDKPKVCLFQIRCLCSHLAQPFCLAHDTLTFTVCLSPGLGSQISQIRSQTLSYRFPENRHIVTLHCDPIWDRAFVCPGSGVCERSPLCDDHMALLCKQSAFYNHGIVVNSWANQRAASNSSDGLIDVFGDVCRGSTYQTPAPLSESSRGTLQTSPITTNRRMQADWFGYRTQNFILFL